MKLNIETLALTCALLIVNAGAATPPTIVCSGDQTLECTSTNGASGVVSVMVQDADGDGLMVVWAINGEPAATNVLAAGTTTNVITFSLTNGFAAGTNDVSVGVTDDGTNVVMCSSTVVVADTTPPTIRSIVATPNLLWPPNHKMRSIQVAVRADDACGPVQWRITEIPSNEAVDGPGDGHSSPDWLIKAPHRALVRAERSGNGFGRIYTLQIEVSDMSQNTTTGTVTVVVPHDRGRGRALPNSITTGSQSTPPASNGKGNGNGQGNGNGNGNGHGKR